MVMDTNDPMNLQDNQGVKLTTSPSNGNLPDNKVTAFLEDKNGEVWIGTARGIARFLFLNLLSIANVHQSVNLNGC